MTCAQVFAALEKARLLQGRNKVNLFAFEEEGLTKKKKKGRPNEYDEFGNVVSW